MGVQWGSATCPPHRPSVSCTCRARPPPPPPLAHHHHLPTPPLPHPPCCRHYMDRLLPLVQSRKYDLAAAVISHRLPLSAGPGAYRMFDRREAGCTKVVLRPWPLDDDDAECVASNTAVVV